jgi:hypothetical protein
MPTLQEYAQGLLDCMVVVLAEANAPACTYFLAPSPNPPFDNCCEGPGNCEGQGWVSLLQSQPVNPFFGQPCGRDFLITFRMGLTRCAHTVSSDFAPPTPEQITQDAEKMYRDRALLLKAVTCCWTSEFDLDPQEWSIGEGEILPVQGGCMGQLLSVQLRSAECSDCF